MNRLSVIIPSKFYSNLSPCVDAIRAAGETCRIIVVDDSFPERSQPPIGSCLRPSRAVLASWDPVEFVMGEKPFIFARNINVGIKAAGDDDVILLNDDALLATPMGFTLLHNALEGNSQYGLVSAACNNVGNINQHPIGFKGLRDDPRMVCFVCTLIPRRTIDKVGLLDEIYKNYGVEDDDYCLRVRNAGMKIGIFDGCFVDHSKLTSTFRGGPNRGGDFRPNLRRFIEKWGVDNHGNSRETSDFKDCFPDLVEK